MQQIVSEFPKKVRWVYRHFPLDQLHQQARLEALAVECARDQGKFWELTNAIFAVTPSNDGLDNSHPQRSLHACFALEHWRHKKRNRGHASYIQICYEFIKNKILNIEDPRCMRGFFYNDWSPSQK